MVELKGLRVVPHTMVMEMHQRQLDAIKAAARKESLRGGGGGGGRGSGDGAGNGAGPTTSWDEFEESLGMCTVPAEVQAVEATGIGKLGHLRFMSERQIKKMGLCEVSTLLPCE